MKRTHAVALSILILSCFSIIGTPQTHASSVGVDAGNEFTYRTMSYYRASNASAFPQALTNWNLTNWYQVRIERVVDSNVTITVIQHPKNGGNDTIKTGVFDIETGLSGVLFYDLYPANLTVGNKLHPSSQNNYTVTETTLRNYPEGARETNTLIVNWPENYDYNLGTNSTTRWETYFDKATGMLVGKNNTTVSADNSIVVCQSFELVSTNVWAAAIPELSPWIIPPFLIAALLITAVAKRKAAKSKRISSRF